MKAISINAYEIKNDDGETMVFMTPKEFSCIKIIEKQNELKDKEIERLNKELEKYKKRCFKGLKLIRDNYGLLDKYGVDMLDDILKGVDKE